VLNGGIPHANSDNIAALVRGEMLEYEPDVITVYAGYNDAVEVLDANSLQTVLRWLHGHAATYVALKSLISLAGGPEIYSRWAKYAVSTSGYVDRQIGLHVTRYEKNLRDMLSLASMRGASVILMRQAVKVDGPTAQGPRTYDEKIRALSKAMDAGRPLVADEIAFVIHAALMATLDKVAREHHVPVVDNIAIADAHPEYFASYVHLTEHGNEALAAALADAIAGLNPRSIPPPRERTSPGRDVRHGRRARLTPSHRHGSYTPRSGDDLVVVHLAAAGRIRPVLDPD